MNEPNPGPQPPQAAPYDGRPHPYCLQPGLATYRCPVCRRPHYEGTRVFGAHLVEVAGGDVRFVPRVAFFALVRPLN